MITGSICEDFLIKSDQIKNTTISGYASVYDVIDSQNDIISKGAFGEVLAENIRFLWQHDRNKPIGIIKKIYEDHIGLRIEAEINNNIICGREASELLIQKALDGLSVGVLARHQPVPMEMVAVNDSFGESGKPEELLVKYGIDTPHLVAAAKKAISRKK